MTHPTLTNDFPPATREEWLVRVEGVLKGADFEGKLVGRTLDGIKVQPLSPKAEGAAAVHRAETGPWRISQRMDHPDLALANEQALADLAGGADSLTLVAAKAPAARGFGLGIDTLGDLDRALAGVELDLIHIRLDAGGDSRQIAALFAALADKRGLPLSELSVDFGLDPIGAMAAMGRLSASWDEVGARMAQTQGSLAERGFSGRVFLSDARPYHEGGASEAQELAAVLATGTAYLRALQANGVALDAARRALAFLLVADADEYLNVAKFRALRRLWARVEQACGLAPMPIRLHAETAWRMTTRRDPWVNILRTTLAAFSAGLGGADSITILPFTTALGLPDAFARRVARNTHLILIEEAHLARVADPASGAGGFEALTDELCAKAWAAFQQIEGEGGIVESLKAGGLQGRIAETRAQREKAVAIRREPITGTSEFPNLHEAPVSVLLPSPGSAAPAEEAQTRTDIAAPSAQHQTTFAALIEMASGGATRAELARAAAGPAPLLVDPLPSIRVAEPFERLRDRSDAYMTSAGTRPKVLLAALGPVASFTARAGFAGNFFEAGGIEAVMPEAAVEPQAVLSALERTGASMICLCASDAIYRAEAAAMIEALRQSTDAPIYMAGRPGEAEKSWRQAGASGFIFAGCDAVAALEGALAAAGA